MAPSQAGFAPTLEKFLKSLKGQSLEASVEGLMSLVYLFSANYSDRADLSVLGS